MTYLERYLNGDCETVWSDLTTRKASVRKESTYADAYAVALETMRRVRTNVETLYKRLRDMGYHFQLDDIDDLRADAPRMLREHIEQNPLYKAIMQMGYKDMDEMEAEFAAQRDASENSPDSPYPKPVHPPRQDITIHLNDFERHIGLLPLSVRGVK